MNKKVRQILLFIVLFGLGGGLMWWQYSNLDAASRESFHTGLRNANYLWFAVAVLIGMCAHLLRAIRWKALLDPLNQKAKLGNRFYAVMMGYLANYAFLRLGEVVRCTVIKASDDVPFSESFGTVVVERVVDTLCLGLILIIVLLFQFAELQSLWLEYIWNPAINKMSGIGDSPVLLIAMIVGVIVFTGAFFFLRKKVGGKVRAFFAGIKEGLLSVKRVKRPFLFIVQSLLIWTGYFLALFVCFFCFPETSGLTLNTALILVLFGTFGVAFTPGGIGAYQWIIAAILVDLVMIDKGIAASFAWLSWGTQVTTVILFTGIAFAVRPVLNKFQS